MPVGLAWLRQFLHPRRLADPVLGKIRYHLGGCWDGFVRFPPTGEMIAISLPADRSGPSEAQRVFFGDLCKKWPELVESFTSDLLHKVWDFDATIPHGRLWSVVQLHELALPNLAATEHDWEISFWCEEADRFFDVTFKDWQPVSVKVGR